MASDNTATNPITQPKPFPHEKFDFGGSLSHINIFQVDNIATTQKSFEDVLSSPSAPKEWKSPTDSKGQARRQLPSAQHHLRNLSGPPLYREVFKTRGLPESVVMMMMPKIVGYLANIRPMLCPPRVPLHAKTLAVLRDIRARGSAKDWAADAELDADELEVEALWALAIYGTTTDGYGVLFPTTIQLLNETGLTWIMLPPERQKIPACWKTWAEKSRRLRVLGVGSSSSGNSQQLASTDQTSQETAPEVQSANGYKDRDEDEVAFIRTDERPHHEFTSLTNHDAARANVETSYIKTEARTTSAHSISPTSEDEPDDKDNVNDTTGNKMLKHIPDANDNDGNNSMNFLRLNTIEDVRGMHRKISSGATPHIDFWHWIGPVVSEMTRGDWVNVLDEFKLYVDDWVRINLEAAVIQTTMGPATAEKIEQVVRDMQTRQQQQQQDRIEVEPVMSNTKTHDDKAQHKIISELTETAASAQLEVQRLQAALVRQGEAIESIRAEHEADRREMRLAHESDMRQLHMSQEAALQAAVSHLEQRIHQQRFQQQPLFFSSGGGRNGSQSYETSAAFSSTFERLGMSGGARGGGGGPGFARPYQPEELRPTENRFDADTSGHVRKKKRWME